MMTDESGAKVPERIGLIQNGLGQWALWHAGQDQPAAVEYVTLAHAQAMVQEAKAALEKIAEGAERQIVDGEEYVIPMSGHEACRIATGALRALAQRQTGGE
jgi:hypothetical protein